MLPWRSCFDTEPMFNQFFYSPFQWQSIFAVAVLDYFNIILMIYIVLVNFGVFLTLSKKIMKSKKRNAGDISNMCNN